MTPADLLAAARAIVERPTATTAGLWPRAAALLARQALESALQHLWESSPETSGIAQCTMRTQLTCLPAYLDPAAAHQISYTWASLSEACHYHPYELGPTAAELAGWIHTVDELVTSLDRPLLSY
jgi:hypothetical protein